MNELLLHVLFFLQDELLVADSRPIVYFTSCSSPVLFLIVNLTSGLTLLVVLVFIIDPWMRCVLTFIIDRVH